MEQMTQNMETRLSELKSVVAEKDQKLSRAEDEIIKLTEKCAELMTKDLKSGAEDDSWSLGSAGTMADSDSADVRTLKEKLMKLKQSEGILKDQLEVLQSTLQIMVHPEDIEKREYKLKKDITELELQRDELLVTNLNMKTDMAEVEDLKSEVKKLQESDERKTGVIEDLHEKLDKFGEQHSVLLESLQETESSEQNLRDSLTRIQSSENVADMSVNPDEIIKYQQKETHYLHRLDSLEEKDKTLRDRLAQVEEHEKHLEEELDKVREELELTKDINTSQESTILELQQQSVQDQASTKIKELEKKCSNMKLLMSQKMEELEYSRKAIKSLEKDVTEMKTLTAELASFKEKTSQLSEELSLARDINTSQEDTIKQLQSNHTVETDEPDLTESYHEHLRKQLGAEDVEEIQAEYQRETKQLRDEIDTLNKKADKTESKHAQELSALKSKLSKLEKELESSKSKYQIAQGIIDELKTQNKKLSNDGKREFEEQLKDLNTKLQSEKVQNSVHRDVIASMSPQLEKLKCENEAQDNSIKSVNEKLIQAEAELSKKRSESETMRSKVSSLEKKLETSQISQASSEQLAKAKLELETDQLSKVKAELETKTAESDNLAVDLIQLTDKCSDLEKRLETANSDLRAAQTQKSELQKHCDDYSKQLTTLQEKTQQAEQTRAELDVKVAEYQELESEVKAANSQLSGLQTQVSDLKTAHQDEVNSSESYRYSLDAANQKLKELQEASQKMEQQQESTAKELQEKQLRIQELDEIMVKAENDRMEDETKPCLSCRSKLDTIADQAVELEHAGKDNVALRKQIESLAVTHAEDEMQMAGRQNQIQSLKEKLGEKEKQLEANNRSLAELQALVICAAKDIQGLENEQQVLNDQIATKQEEMDDIRSHFQKLKADNQKLEVDKQTHSGQVSQLSSLRTQVSNLSSELNHVNKMNDQTVDSLKQQIYALTQEKTNLQNRNDKLVLEVDNILREKQFYIDEIEAGASKLKANKTSTSEVIAQMQATIDNQTVKLMNTEHALTQQVQDKTSNADDKMKVLSNSNAKLQSELDSLSLTLSEVTQERDALSDKIDAEQAEEYNTQVSYTSLQHSLNQLQAQYDNSLKLQHDVSRENHRLNERVSESESELSSQIEKFNDAQDTIITLNQSVEEERNKAIYLNNKQTEKFKTDLVVLQESLNETETERDELKRKIASMKKPSDDSEVILSLNAEIERWKSKNEELGHQLVQLQSEQLDQLSSASAESSILQAQLENMSEVVDELNNEVQLTSNLKSLSTELQNRLRDEKKEHCQTAAELKELKAEQMTFKEQVEDLKEQLEHSLQQSEELRSELRQCEETMNTQAEAISQEKNNLEQQLNESRTDLQELEDRLNDQLQNQYPPIDIDSLNTELVALKQSLEEKDEMYKQIRKQNEDYNQQLKSEKMKSDNLSSEVVIAQVEIADLRSKASNEQEITQLRSQLDEQKAANELTRAALNALKGTPAQTEELEELRSKTSSQEEYIEALQSESKMLVDQMEFMKSENDDLSGRVSDLYEQVEELSNVNAELKKTKDQLSPMRAECEQVKDQLQSSEKRVSELSNQLNVIKSKNHSLEEELETLQSQTAMVDAQQHEVALQTDTDLSNQLEAQLKEELEANVRRLEEKVRSLERNDTLLQTENDDLSAQLSDLRNEQNSAQRLELSDLTSSDGEGPDIQNLRTIMKEQESKIAQLKESLNAEKTYHTAAESVIEERVTTLTQQNKAKEEKCAELQNMIKDLQQQIDDFNAEDSDSESDETDYKRKYQQSRNHIEVLEFDYSSMETKFKEATDAKIDLGLQVASLKGERDRLAAQVRASPRMDQDNADGVEYRGLQRQIIDLKQKLVNQQNDVDGMEAERADFSRKLQVEKNATKEAQEATKVAEAETRKLQMSISMLMTSHETEMSSLQKALHNAGSKMGDLEVRVADYSHHNEGVNALITKVNTELQEIKSAKESIALLMSDLVSQNNFASTQFQRQLCTLLSQMNNGQEPPEERTSDLSMSLPMDPPLHSTLHDIDNLPNTSTPAPNLSASLPLSFKTESLSTVSHYGRLSKEDLVAKLSDQTKHELILRKTLEESRQSLAFYRSAIDNIIDCLGTSMPGVKKWANDFLNSEDQAFSQHLDAIISNESALQRRCHALEMSEKALTESFETKEKEYQSAIQRLQDMVSLLKSSKDKLAEELKLKNTSTSTVTEEQVTSLKEKVYELEGTVKKLRLQNEEIQFAYEQECERRQIQEEERFKAEQRSRLNTVEVARESEYLSKISSLETKVTNLVRTQHQLENTIDSLRHDSREEELKLQIETLERSERALLRKIEILQQQSENYGSSNQYDNNLDRPEDILRQRIWEMEKMEIHLKQQVSDLEHDREELHEIARSDKNCIHELNIQLAEASLANKNLKAQITRFEQAEEVLYSKLESAETRISELEEKLKEALDNEKTMRYQLEDVEYSEDNLRFRTGNMEKTLETLQTNEAALKKQIDDLRKDRQSSSKDGESWRYRVKGLEEELNRVRNQLAETENREITLKGRISELAAKEASLNIRIREVELDNERLNSKVLHMEKSAVDLRENLSDTFLGKDELNSQIQSIRSSEQGAKSKISRLEEEKFELEKALQDVRFRVVQLQSQTAQDGHNTERSNDRLVTALANEKQSRIQQVKLEAVVAAYESKQTSGVVERENFQLNAENKNLKEKLKTKERDMRDMEEKITRLTAAGNNAGNGGGGTYRINKLQTEIREIQTQLKHSEEVRHTLEITLDNVKDGKTTCGHDVEISKLKMEIDRLHGQLRNVKPLSHQSHTTSTRSEDSPVRWHSNARRGEGKRDFARPQESVRTQCLNELVSTVKQREERKQDQVTEETIKPISSKPFTKYQPTGEESEDEEATVASDIGEDLEVQSQSSLWEKLEPPVRKSPLPLNSARIIRSDSPQQDSQVDSSQRVSPRLEVPVRAAIRPTSPNYAESLHSTSEIAEESSLWEKLELLEPKKKPEAKPVRVDLEFEDGPIAPKYCPRKALSPSLVPGIDVTNDGDDSADEASDLEDIAVVDDKTQRFAATQSLDLPPARVKQADSQATDSISESSKQLPALHAISPQAALVMETKDIARLKQTIADLERKLKSRDTEIQMLRNTQKEIKRDSNLSGDVFTMKAKLRSLQEQVESGENKISALRNEIISRDKNLTNRQKEIIDLRMELRKYSSQSLAKPEDGPPSALLSPGVRQRPIQMCTSPGRQTTIERDPAELYKTMVESKEAHIRQLTKQLEEKKSAVARLERELTDTKIAMPSPTDPDAAKFKYLDDKYTEAATRCYNMKIERDDWKKKYEELHAEHQRCSHLATSGAPAEEKKCQNCKHLKREIRRLQKELHACRKKLAQKVLESKSGRGSHNREHAVDDDDTSMTSEQTLTQSESIGSLNSIPDDVINYVLHSSTNGSRPHNSSSLTNGSSNPSRERAFSSPTQRSRSQSPTKQSRFKIPQSFKPRYYDVITDYNPQYFSTSGRADKEVQLSQGQRIKVLEQPDENGYSKAEVNSKIVLVPMKYLQLVASDQIDKEYTVNNRRAQLSQLSNTMELAPTQQSQTPAEMMNRTFPPSPSQRTDNLRPSSVSPGRAQVQASPITTLSSPVTINRHQSSPSSPPQMILSSENKQHRKPRAPSNLKVEIVANQKLYIEWSYVHHLDHETKSNGTTVTGYRVFLNGRTVSDVRSPYITVCSLEVSTTLLSDLHTVSVQTTGENNLNSSLTHATVSPYLESANVSSRDIISQINNRGDNSQSPSRKRLFMAYYDYDPVKQGPYSRGFKKTCNDELPLKTGDFVVVYGETKPNGFYLGEINGRRGHVPEAFIRQVPAENAKHYGYFDNDAHLPR